MSLPTGFDQYRIETLLGAGRLAQTYRAVDTVRRRVVALKLLRSDLSASAGCQILLAQVAPAVDLIHPHIAWLWEAVQTGDDCYLVERYASGPNLTQALGRSGPLDWPQARQALGQLVQAVEFAHAHGWVHGAIHPGNIILSPELGAVLTDFTLARLAGLQPGSQALFAADDQHAGWSLYQAPEVRLGDPAVPASDQYALACALLEMLAGRPLSVSAVTADQEASDTPDSPQSNPSQLDEPGVEPADPSASPAAAPDPLAPPAFPASWPPGAPDGLSDVLQRALALEPDDRYPTPGAFLQALDALQPTPSDEAQLQAWRTQQTNARRSTEDQARRRVEDAARLAALEQARREIAAQLDQPAAVSTPSQTGAETAARTESTAAPAEAPSSQAAVAAAPAAARRRSARRADSRRWWPLGLGLLVVLLALGGFWLDSRLPRSLLFPPTPTATLPSATPTLPPSPTPTASPTATATATLTPTLTATYTVTATFTPPATPSPTFTATNTFTPEPSATRLPTATPTRRVNRDG